jgi:cation transport protein ChaC
MAPRRPALTRDLVARLPERIPDPGPMPGAAEPSPERRQRVLSDLLARRLPDGTIWLFAYGSLMWQRPFAIAEERPARVRGWHRAFCLGPDTRYRGNPEAPGLMLSLDRGGQCQGLAFRLPAEGLEAALLSLIEREPPYPPSWVRAQTAQGVVPAFAFTCPRSSPFYAGRLPEEDLARRLSCAVGKFGSMPDYILNALDHLRALGIRDRLLERTASRVAAELEAMPPA